MTSLPMQKALSSLSEARLDPDTTKELAQDRNVRYKQVNLWSIYDKCQTWYIMYIFYILHNKAIYYPVLSQSVRQEDLLIFPCISCSSDSPFRDILETSL